MKVRIIVLSIHLSGEYQDMTNQQASVELSQKVSGREYSVFLWHNASLRYHWNLHLFDPWPKLFCGYHPVSIFRTCIVIGDGYHMASEEKKVRNVNVMESKELQNFLS